MTDEIHRELAHMMDIVPGLLAISISDRDGIPVLKASKDTVPESALRSAILAAISSTTDQGAKFGSGQPKTAICQYKHFQVILLNQPPFVVTLIGSSTASTGLLLGLEETFKPILEELTSIIRD